MADGMIRRLTTIGWTVVGLLFSVACCAEDFPDPTRPPAAIAAPVVAAASGIAAAEGLQSIFISKTRRAAIMDGKTVELGGKYNDAKLVEVAEDRVVLQGARGRQVMMLFPDVKLTSKQEEAATAPAARVRVKKPNMRKEKK